MTLEGLDPGQPANSPDQDACPEPESILALFSGELSPEQAEPIRRHVNSCASCQLVLGEAERCVGSHPTMPSLERSSDFPPEPSSESDSQEDSNRLGGALSTGSILAERYRIERFVERGGMGEIYEVHDLILGENVALKTLPFSALTNPEAIARLKVEVKLSRRVGNTHTCRIFDFGKHIDKTGPNGSANLMHFLTMEFVHGRVLGKLLRDEGRLEESLVAPMALQMLDGLCASHQAGVLHRDFKSDNVMLRNASPLHKADQVVLLDFGLAKALHQDSERLTSNSQTLLGSAAYMAPEQAVGQPLTESADIYAFGVVLFEMLTGRLPFQSNSPMSTVLMRLRQAAPKPSSHTPELGTRWDVLVSGCLQKDISKRFNARQIRAALRELAPQCDDTHYRLPVAPLSWRTASSFAAGCALSGMLAFAFLASEAAPNISEQQLDTTRLPLKPPPPEGTPAKALKGLLREAEARASRWFGLHNTGDCRSAKSLYAQYLRLLATDAPERRSVTMAQAKLGACENSATKPQGRATDPKRTPSVAVPLHQPTVAPAAQQPPAAQPSPTTEPKQPASKQRPSDDPVDGFL